MSVKLVPSDFSTNMEHNAPSVSFQPRDNKSARDKQDHSVSDEASSSHPDTSIATQDRSFSEKGPNRAQFHRPFHRHNHQPVHPTSTMPQNCPSPATERWDHVPLEKTDTRHDHDVPRPPLPKPENAEHQGLGIWPDTGAPFRRPTSKSHPREDLPSWNFWALLVSNCFLTIMHGYDVSNVANIQAPIYSAFGHIELMRWVALSYSVCNNALIPLGRKLFKFGDFKTLNLVSMLFIIAGSVLAGAAPTIECIIAGRALMALGTSVIYQGILSFNIIFCYAHELGLVQAVLGACFAIGLVLGPIIGGAFADNEHATWRWAFYLVVPLCVISLILQALFSPHYRVATDKPAWTHIKETDWVGNLLHMGVCVLFAVGCGFLGSIGTHGAGAAIVTWTVFVLVVVAYAIQQACNIGTTPERRLLSSCALLNDRTILNTWICTCGSAAAYGTLLYYVPIYFAFAHAYGPLAAAVRLLPFIGVFIFTIILSGVLLPAVRVYKPFFLVGTALILIGGGLFQTLTVDTPEAAVMGFEALVAAGIGLTWQLGVSVCTVFLHDTEDRLDLALLSNMAQLGGIAAALAIAGMVYQSTGFESLKSAIDGMGLGFSGEDIRELLSGADSPILAGSDPVVMRLAVEAITDAVKSCFTIIPVAGGLSFLAACFMKWEALDFKQPATQQPSGGIDESPGDVPGPTSNDDEFLLSDLSVQRPGTGSIRPKTGSEASDTGGRPVTAHSHSQV
ncbi:hypothetical protein AAE478_006876 [Parahypoxylon ruwenzoriense]